MPLLYLFITGNYSHKLKLSKWYTSFFKQYFIIICVIDTKKGISIKNILNVSLTQLWKCLPAFLFLWTTPFIVCGRTQDLNYHGTNPCKKMSSIMTALFFFLIKVLASTPANLYIQLEFYQILYNLHLAYKAPTSLAP